MTASTLAAVLCVAGLAAWLVLRWLIGAVDAALDGLF